MGMLEDVRDYLVAGGITTPIYGGTMPNLPDKLIALYDTTGYQPERAMGRIAADKRNLQVLVRDLKAVDAEALSRTIFNLLDRFVGVLGTTRYDAILGKHTPFSIGADENNRRTFSCNYEVTKDWV